MRTHPAHARSHERVFFVYFLMDEAGEVLYVGRSQNVARRLLGHLSDASSPDTTQAPRKALWLGDVRSVSMIGPFTWAEAVAEERRQIETVQPFGNIRCTTRDRQTRVGRGLVAVR